MNEYRELINGCWIWVGGGHNFRVPPVLLAHFSSVHPRAVQEIARTRVYQGTRDAIASCRNRARHRSQGHLYGQLWDSCGSRQLPLTSSSMICETFASNVSVFLHDFLLSSNGDTILFICIPLELFSPLLGLLDSTAIFFNLSNKQIPSPW